MLLTKFGRYIVLLNIFILVSCSPQVNKDATIAPSPGVPLANIDAPVAIAVDTSSDPTCRQNDKPCPPGSSIDIRTSTYREVLQNNIKDFVFLTGNTEQDAKLMQKLSNDLHRKLSRQRN